MATSISRYFRELTVEAVKEPDFVSCAVKVKGNNVLTGFIHDIGRTAIPLTPAN